MFGHAASEGSMTLAGDWLRGGVDVGTDHYCFVTSLFSRMK